MDLQAEAVSELAQYRLKRARFEADGNDLVVVGEYDEVDLLVLYRNVGKRSTLVFELGQRIQDHRWDATHEFPVISLRG